MDTPHTSENQQLNFLRYRCAVERVHRIGPRAVTELLAEADVPLDLIERYAGLDRFSATTLNIIGADRFPPDLFAVGGGR